MAQCRRFGIVLQHDAIVDPIALDASLSAAKADVDARVVLKTNMAQLRLID
jgi:hypothetical protein